MADAAERQATETPLIPELPGRDRSLWIDTVKSVEYPHLAGNIETDVAILGGGIAGITAAHALHKAGLRVTILESRRILRGVTGNTTAKLTAAHGLIYAHLVDHFGPEKARLYALANQRAIDHVERMIGEFNIQERAHFRRMPAYTFLRDTKRTDEIRAEAEATARCGLPAAFVDSFDLFFPIAGAVRVDEQAVFHPLLYLQALADDIAGPEAASPGTSNGSRIYENTRALEVKSPKKDADPVEVLTDRGAVRANAVIVATHQPFMYEGAYFARVSPKRSYVLHLRFPEALPDHLANAHYYGPETPYLSLRPTADGQGLLVGGQNHKTGEGKRMHEHYQNLEKQARELFGDKPTVEHRWSTQDGVSVDKVPFIGPLTPGSDRVFVATGFGGWGMSNGVVAGIVLSELVQGRTHEWAEVFDPSRIKPETSAGEFLKHNLGAAKHLIGDHLKNLTKPDLVDLYPGQARVMGAGTEKLAVYRDPAGKVHVCSAICTHLGCVVNWNSAERSWDCPCHGSRFTPEGEVLQGPAVKDLQKGKIRYE